MSRPVYSTRLLGAVGLVGTLSYTVPAGFVAVIRDLDAYNGGGITVTNITLHGSGGQTIWQDDSTTLSRNSAWRGRQVIFAGETFDVHTTGAWDVTVSGYLLSTP